jgi:hypothetical protein
VSSIEGINEKFVLNTLASFVRKQRLQRGIVQAADLVFQGDIDKAEGHLLTTLRQTIAPIDPGLFVKDFHSALSEEGSPYPPSLGFRMPDPDIKGHYIDLLQIAGIGPQPGELMTFMAPTGRGKTWFLTQAGRYCAMQRLKVLHLTLEISTAKQSRRYLQALFGLNKRSGEILLPHLHMVEGEVATLKYKKIIRPSVFDRAWVSKMMGKKDRKYQGMTSKYEAIVKKLPLIVKQFPTRSLTISGLEAYLDFLDRTHDFTPDVLIIDYADLMKVDASNLRIELGSNFMELRRIAGERNFAIITASQANRMAEDAKQINLKHMAEDYSKAATSDIVLCYVQTDEEKSRGLGRVYVAKNRDDESGQYLLITQAYGIGQFALQCFPMRNSDQYFSRIDKFKGMKDDTEAGGREVSKQTNEESESSERPKASRHTKEDR